MTSTHTNGKYTAAVYLKMFLVLVVVGLALSADGPGACRDRYEDWKFFKKYSELESYLRLVRCLSTYCKTTRKGKAIFACIIRHSAVIPIQYFVE
ncbi:hypothetical protein ScPMuIL_016132 [Solemya velum]